MSIKRFACKYFGAHVGCRVIVMSENIGASHHTISGGLFPSGTATAAYAPLGASQSCRRRSESKHKNMIANIDRLYRHSIVRHTQAFSQRESPIVLHCAPVRSHVRIDRREALTTTCSAFGQSVARPIWFANTEWSTPNLESVARPIVPADPLMRRIFFSRKTGRIISTSICSGHTSEPRQLLS